MVDSNAVTEGKAFDFINAQYAVFLGVIFNFSFSVEEQVVEVAIPPDRLVIIIPLVFYFMLDWLTTHIFRRLKPETLIVVFFYSVGIVVLSIVIVMMNSVSPLKYVLLGIYCVLVGCYDLYLAAGPLRNRRPVWNTTVASLRVGFAVAIVLVSLAALLNAQALEELDDTLELFVLMLVFLKLVRVISYAREEHPAIGLGTRTT